MTNNPITNLLPDHLEPDEQARGDQYVASLTHDRASMRLINTILSRLDRNMMRRNIQEIAAHIITIEDTSRAVSIPALLASAVLMAVDAGPPAGGWLPDYQENASRWVGHELWVDLQSVDRYSEFDWRTTVKMAVALQRQSSADPDLTNLIISLITHVDVIVMLFEITSERYSSSFMLLQRFYADMLDDTVPEGLYPLSLCHILLKRATSFWKQEVTQAHAPILIAQQQINDVRSFCAFLLHRAGQSIPSIPLYRRVDAAAPEQAQIDQVFDLLVQVQLPDAPPLSAEAWPAQRRSLSIVKIDEQLVLEFPVNPLSGQINSTELEIRIIAPYCEIGGGDRRRISVPSDRASALVFFILRPTRIGLCPINIELYRVDHLHLGIIPIDVHISGNPVESPLLVTSLTIFTINNHLVQTVNWIQGDNIQTGAVSGSGIAIGQNAQVYQRTINTQGGDYTEGNLDKRQGTFVEGDLFITEEQRYNVAGMLNPYLGLRAFTASDQDIFAGRELIVRALADRLSADDGDRLLFIVGTSGSGKSSLARAGVLPNLALRLRAAGYQVHTQEIDHPGRLPTTAWERLYKHIHDLLDSVSSNLYLILIDQAEEIFSIAEPSAREQALNLLAESAKTVDLPVRIIATMRSDFLQKLVDDARFAVVEQRKIVLRAMTSDELQDAIQRPVQVRYEDKKQLEPALVERLVRDASNDTAYLPLLQVTLEDLWRGGVLRLSAYQGLASAIQRRADAVYDFCDYDGAKQEQRSPDEQQAMLRLCLELVRVSLIDPHHDVRWRRARAEITHGNPQYERLISDLAGARLLRTDHEDGSETVDLIHETLLTSWPRLRDAIASKREFLQRRERFLLALQEWEAHQRHDDYLLSAVRLAEADTLRQGGESALMSEAAQQLYEQSVQQRTQLQERQLRIEQRSRRLFQTLAGMLAVLLATATVILVRPVALRSMARWASNPHTITGQSVAFEPFEVTNRRYRWCVEAGRCLQPVGDVINIANDQVTPYSTYFLTETLYREWPVTGIDGIQAAYFCDWIGRRLPTVDEWQAAATNNNQTQWPWGNDPPSSERTVLDFGQRTMPEEVGSRRNRGISQDGIDDLIGNVWEFTSVAWQRNWSWTPQQPNTPDALTAVGGAYTSGSGAVAPMRVAITARDRAIGFRCVEDRR